MIIRRFKKPSWSDNGKGLEYIEYVNGVGKRVKSNGETLLDDYETVSLRHCIDTYEELPCYTDQLIEGDIAVVKVSNRASTHYTWYVFDTQDGGDTVHLAAVCLTHKGKYWDINNSAVSNMRVVALLGNAFDSERLTYGVQKYVK